MRIVRQRIFSEENNNLSNVGEGLTLLGGVGAYSSSMLAKDLKKAQKKGKEKVAEAGYEAFVKNSQAIEELAAEEEKEIQKLKEKAREEIKKGKSPAWFNIKKDQLGRLYEESYHKIMDENRVPVEKVLAENKKIDKALRKARWGMGISAASAAAGGGMYLKGRRKDKED